ncbi:trimeric intracellular cation channel family protein [Castellaniella sp.]|uniref:trimeric intracellular cation channel family protein n=1 Tax=Castellaniella sp. TaxID=1955812 RepID=UPI002AFEE873|nr:trimeric intracellular cation channel family protein [Castellaniella sp.]
MPAPDITSDFLHVLFLVAIAAEAMTAALAAGRREMDWLGVCLLGCITALGGGSVRDVLLDHHPLSWIAHPYYLLITGGAALATVALARFAHSLRHLFLFLDAVGLVVFTIIGVDIALGLSLPWSIAIISGMITGCVGGVLRDVLCNEIPLLFRAELYATVSIVSAALYLGGLYLAWNHNLVVVGSLLIGLTLRLLALRFCWSMPKFVYTRDLH